VLKLNERRSKYALFERSRCSEWNKAYWKKYNFCRQGLTRPKKGRKTDKQKGREKKILLEDLCELNLI
jgi:hypothetical protein